MIIVRNFRKDDLQGVISLVYKTFGEFYSENFYMDLSKEWEDGIIVAEKDKEIIAVIVGTLLFPKEAKILVFTVDENYRNRRLGSYILREFIDRAVLKDSKIISLEVRIQNERGIRFYQRFGFQISSLLKKYYKDGGDAYLMQKFL